jgi:organic radical activating enzyme
MTYRVNEIFSSIQGEGMRAGTANVFIRFSGCNLKCVVATHGFDCDTEFTSGEDLSVADILGRMGDVSHGTEWCILTGGEPLLQVDKAFIDELHYVGWKIAIETNGTKPLPAPVDWVSVSPKTAEHALKIERADELRYVRNHGQGIPKPRLKAEHYCLSPAFEADGLSTAALSWCIKLVKENPEWRLSIQQHKLWGVR